jgi:hypothetical protein
MQALRWSLGVVSLLAGIGWLALGVLGNSFRGSFGASPVDLVTRVGPVIVMALVLASVLMPGNKALLHVTAVIVAAACVGGVMVLRESVFVGTTCLAYGAAWFVFYARSF